MDNKRGTAFKLCIKDVLSKHYVVQEGWEPNYININGIKASRVNIIGIIINNENNQYVIDDGTAEISVRSFEPLPSSFNVGDVIQIIGRPREYNGERYIAPETMQSIPKEWIEVRKKELKFVEQTQVSEEKNEQPKSSINQQVLQKIEALDSGEGVIAEELVKEMGDIESTIADLLMEGEIFEIRPGVLKLLN